MCIIICNKHTHIHTHLYTLRSSGYVSEAFFVNSLIRSWQTMCAKEYANLLAPEKCEILLRVAEKALPLVKAVSAMPCVQNITEPE